MCRRSRDGGGPPELLEALRPGEGDLPRFLQAVALADATDARRDALAYARWNMRSSTRYIEGWAAWEEQGEPLGRAALQGLEAVLVDDIPF